MQFAFQRCSKEIVSNHVPTWGATSAWRIELSDIHVSIHAPRVGGDETIAGRFAPVPGFNPRPPRGGRLHWHGAEREAMGFQSTPPAWGATTLAANHCLSSIVSIHAPRVGGDFAEAASGYTGKVFQSTPPAWGATRVFTDNVVDEAFQSTPPAWGATLSFGFVSYVTNCFNPRPPRGGRRYVAIYYLVNSKFQSTPPAWGATRKGCGFQTETLVSIHAPRVGGDAMLSG